MLFLIRIVESCVIFVRIFDRKHKNTCGHASLCYWNVIVCVLNKCLFYKLQVDRNAGAQTSCCE